MDTVSGIMRPYQASHPWLTFRVDLSEAPPLLWLLLGEAASKCEHIAGVPLKAETAQKLHQLFLAKGALATTAIEGNTLTEEQALLAVEGKLDLPKSQEYLATELHNILDAVGVISSRIQSGEDAPLEAEDIHEYNGTVLKGLELQSGVVPGAVRVHPVAVGGVYLGAPAEDCDYLLERLTEWIYSRSFAAPEGQEVHFAILKAILAHLYIAWIHPYGDGNGRTARLVEFHILATSGVPTPAVHLLSNHYNQTKSEYYRRLDLASKSHEGVVGFIMYAVQGLVDGLKAQIDVIQDQQMELIWNDYVDGLFGNSQSPADLRRRQLIADLAHAGMFVPKSDIKSLSPKLEYMYSRLTAKALSRDLNSPVVRQCVEQSGNHYRARKEIVQSFMPRRTA